MKKKCMEDTSFCAKIMSICYTVSKIRHVTDLIFIIKVPRDIINLTQCTINDNYMMYLFWDMKWDRHNIFVILGHYFLPFYPTNNTKNLNFEKTKKENVWRYHHFVPKIMIICYTVSKIEHVTEVIFILHFGLFFDLLRPQHS